MSIPYFPLYVIDYEADTTHLTMEEDGCYMRLLRLCWRTPGCSIPNDPAWIARRLRITAEDYERIAAIVISEFFKCEKGRLFSPRLSEEHARISDTFEKRSNAGKKGGRPPKSLKTNKTDESRVKAGPKQPEPEPEPYKEPPKPPKGQDVLDALCQVVSEPTASAFIQHRRELKKPLTLTGAKAMATKLRNSPDPDSVMNTSIANGWQGVFPERQAKPTHQGARHESAEAQTYRLMGMSPPKPKTRERLDA